jgi:protein ImuB
MHASVSPHIPYGGPVVCVHLPRFALVVAAGGSEALAGRPLAITPTGGGARGGASSSAQVLGEVSGTAQARGVRAGMDLGEALTLCPELVLVPGDPLALAQAWETAILALEDIGARIEPACPGIAYFDASGLNGLYGDVHGTIATARKALGRPARIGAGPTRFCALAAALESSTRRARVVDGRAARRYLASQPVGLLAHREQTAALVACLERLSIGTLGDLASLGASAIADRFGRPGTIARELALGNDEPLRPRVVEDLLQESMRLGESNSGQALERALEILVDRLLARPERRGRTIGAIALGARLVERGAWRELVVFREAICDRRRMHLALSLRLSSIPAPAETLQLSVERFGPAAGDQGSLLDGERTERRRRLREAVRQVRAVAGPYAALRAHALDPRSRVPERRFGYAPWPQ